MPASPKALLGPILKGVSRSFHKTLRVLPGKIRSQIGLACTTDTVADTNLLPVDRRLEALKQLRQRIAGVGQAPIEFGELALKQSSSAERILLENCEQALVLLERMSGSDRQLIQQVLEIITSGQELDL